MNKKTLNEAYVLSKKLDHKGNNIAYIDPTKSENQTDTYQFREFFKKHGANWNKFDKYWYWYIGKTGDQWRNVYTKMIEPALRGLHKLEGATTEDSESSLVSSLAAVISMVEATPTSEGGGEGELKPNEKNEIIGRLDKFKEMLVNLDNDEEFKKTMQTLTALKNAQGHKYSFNNTILVWIQNPKATIFKSEINWKNYNRIIVDKTKRMLIWSPGRNSISKYSPEEKEKITNAFLKSVGKTNISQLGAGQQEELKIKLRGSFSGSGFDLTPVYDIANTAVMEGKEDLAADLLKKNDIKWFKEGDLTEEVRPIYNALMEFAKENGIVVEFHSIDDMGGSRGVSKSGSIDLPTNEGNDVGVTKTFAHELTHEILHQKYLKDKNPKFKDYFLGTAEGRELVEQQAELSAWAIMDSYGFDVKMTSSSYIALWGADSNAMVKVFDTVSGVINLLLDYVNARKNNVTEVEGGATLVTAKHVTPEDIAKILGVEQEYNTLKKKDVMVEHFFKLVKKVI